MSHINPDLDPEIQAIGAVAAALKDLDGETQARVLKWAAERFSVGLPQAGRSGPRDVQQERPDMERGGESAQSRSHEIPRDEPVFHDFVDLFDAIDPKTDPDKALTGAYWLQVVQRNPSWQAIRVNNLLKDTGHGLGNVTTSMTSLQGRKPALVRQMAKAGKSQQARKTYKLTTSGVAYVRNKLGLGTSVPPALADHGEDEA